MINLEKQLSKALTNKEAKTLRVAASLKSLADWHERLTKRRKSLSHVPSNFIDGWHLPPLRDFNLPFLQ